MKRQHCSSLFLLLLRSRQEEEEAGRLEVGRGRKIQEEGAAAAQKQWLLLGSLSSFTANCSHWKSLETSFSQNVEDRYSHWSLKPVSIWRTGLPSTAAAHLYPYILLGAGLAQTSCLNKLKPKKENQPWWLKTVLIILSPASWSLHLVLEWLHCNSIK